MQKVFVKIKSEESNNPIEAAIKKIISLLGDVAEVVEQITQGDEDADIAITNSVSFALKMTKETERTIIVIAYLPKEKEEVTIFASRYPNRILTTSLLGLGNGETDIVSYIFQLIADKNKEA